MLASIEEGLALVIAQAMACGLPVIATEATGVRELITDGVEGIVVPDASGCSDSRRSDGLLVVRQRSSSGDGRGRPGAKSSPSGGGIAMAARWWRPFAMGGPQRHESCTAGDRRHQPHPVPGSALSPPGSLDRRSNRSCSSCPSTVSPNHSIRGSGEQSNLTCRCSVGTSTESSVTAVRSQRRWHVLGCVQSRIAERSSDALMSMSYWCTGTAICPIGWPTPRRSVAGFRIF